MCVCVCAATACFGSDPTQFPSSNLFAAAGDGIWDNGASCGRQYLVNCISADDPGTCIAGQTVRIIIVDHAPSVPSMPSAPGKTMVLSDTAFEAIAVSPVPSISIEFLQLSVMSTEASFGTLIGLPRKIFLFSD